MTDKERIEKLKKPELAQPLGILDEYFPEMAEIIRRAEPENCLYWQFGNKTWQGASGLQLSLCYILKPGYKPEPEYEDIEIVVVRSECRLRSDCPNSMYRFLWWAMADEDFRGFFYDDGGTPCRISIDRVAEYVAKGLKVYARFVKVNT